MRVILTLIVVAGLGVGGFFVWQEWQRKQAAALEAKRVSMAIVEARDISFTIHAAGEIGPADQVSVRPEINGKIADMDVYVYIVDIICDNSNIVPYKGNVALIR